MSARLRDAARALLRDVEEDVRIARDSPLGQLRDALADEDRRLLDIEPNVVNDHATHVARLVEALQHFAKPGGHFVGCPGDKGGLCSAACRTAQLACDRRTSTTAADTVSALHAEIAALRREWRHVRGRLHNQKLIHRRVLQQVQAETGFVMRSPGRPKTVAPLSEAKGGTAVPTTATRSLHETLEPLAEHAPDREP